MIYKTVLESTITISEIIAGLRNDLDISGIAMAIVSAQEDERIKG